MMNIKAISDEYKSYSDKMNGIKNHDDLYVTIADKGKQKLQ